MIGWLYKAKKQIKSEDAPLQKRVLIKLPTLQGTLISVFLVGMCLDLAVRTPVKLLPQVKFGRDLHFWLIATGLDKFPFPLFGRPVSEPTTVIDSAGFKERLESGKPNEKPMFTSMYEDGVVWVDREKEEVDAVIFATGFQPNLSFLTELNALDDRGFPRHKAGVSNATNGLYFVGLSGQRSLASATLRGVGDDARYVVRKLMKFV